MRYKDLLSTMPYTWKISTSTQGLVYVCGVLFGSEMASGTINRHGRVITRQYAEYLRRFVGLMNRVSEIYDR